MPVFQYSTLRQLSPGCFRSEQNVTQTLLAPKRNSELETMKEYTRTITDGALDSLVEIYNILQSRAYAHPFVAGTWDV